MVWDDVHGPGWEDVVQDREAQSRMRMHSLGWGCMVWNEDAWSGMMCMVQDGRA